ncbi:membrane protein [Sphingomonas kaistensis]|uniref:Membrane protein n=1 Tax=Sphingomonas kaistensis TaxID=298708 RepID=A0A7X5YAY5_9SPHN|nr:HAD-IA family hydrolase [Sphingomonas kaistensis]NJC06791.1 membrane protein [Sphingomonas kaistensis]
MFRAILFDVDGTLVDSNQFHVLAWAEAFHAAGHDFRLADIHAQIGKGTDNFVPALLPDASAEEIEKLAAAHRALFARLYMHRLKPFPGARQLLQRCRDEGLKVMLATSASGRELERHLDVLDARGIVDGWTSADDVGHSKPCPDLFEAAAQRIGVAPDEALVVGDSPYDIRAAGAAGIRAVAVRSGLFDDEALAGAIAIYDNVGDLLDRFDESPLSGRSATGGQVARP